MFHVNTQRMIDYWTMRAAPGRAPERASIDPTEFHQLMNQTFILGRATRGAYPVRLAGGFISGLHGGAHRTANILSLWSERDRLRLQNALEEIRRTPGPLVVTAEALTEGPGLRLEVLFMPLNATATGLERYLGLYQPLAMVSRLQNHPVIELSVRAFHRPRTALGDVAQSLRLATLHGARMA